MLIGRERELAKLCAAIRTRRSLLLYGVAGSGKSALLDSALASLPPSIRSRWLVCSAAGTPHSVYQNLTRVLGAAGDPEILSRAKRENGSTEALDSWISCQTSLRLRGVLRRATRSREYSVFLDAPEPIPPAVCRLLKDWIWSGCAPVVVLARGSSETELGKAARLFWHDGMRLALGALDLAAARVLLEHSIARQRLTGVADEEFRQFVLRASAALPGQILRLCEMASQASYQCEGHIKLHTLGVDLLLHRAMPPRQPPSGPFRHG